MKKLFLSLFFTFSFILLPIDNVEAVSKSAVKRDCKLKNFRSGVWKVRIDPRNTDTDNSGRMYFEAQFRSNGTMIASKTTAYDYYNPVGGSGYGIGVVESDSGLVVQTTSTGKRACQVGFVFSGYSWTNSAKTSGYAIDITAVGYAPGNELKKNSQGQILLPNATISYGGGSDKQSDVFLQRIL